MKRKTKTCKTEQDAIKWIAGYKKKPNIILISSGYGQIKQQTYYRGGQLLSVSNSISAYVVYDKTMTDDEERAIRKREREYV